jgi:hypothetical protein
MRIKQEIKSGTVFGVMMVIKEVEPKIRSNGHQRRHFLMKCKCGKEHISSLEALRSGDAKSCGCLKIEKFVNYLKTRNYKKHGMSHSREYQSWHAMMDRCRNPNRINYNKYGGVGIGVCERWYDFRNFYKDMGSRPEGTSIDRIDNNGNYEPNNCRWATTKQQNNNLSNNVIIFYQGETMCASDWSKRLGGCESVVASRLSRGWDIKKSVTTPLLYSKHKNYA